MDFDPEWDRFRQDVQDSFMNTAQDRFEDWIARSKKRSREENPSESSNGSKPTKQRRVDNSQ